jgi:OmpA-OmpF porin, OOP family
MSPQRRNADRRTAQSLERLWQVYADEVGLPRSGEAREPLPERPGGQAQPSRPAPARASGFGRPVAVVAVVVAVIAGIALWRESSTSPGNSNHPSSKLASARADRVAPPAAPSQRPGAAPQAAGLAPAARPGSSSSGGAGADPVPPTATRARQAARERTGVADQVNFDVGSDRISEESKPTLDKIAVAMKRNDDWRMVIEGHADAQGSPEDNRALSERRAQAVKTYLQSAGIAPARLTAVGFGASRPIAPNDVRGYALNRRVELHRR